VRQLKWWNRRYVWNWLMQDGWYSIKNIEINNDTAPHNCAPRPIEFKCTGYLHITKVSCTSHCLHTHNWLIPLHSVIAEPKMSASLNKSPISDCIKSLRRCGGSHLF
jgi:hypothetical protein